MEVIRTSIELWMAFDLDPVGWPHSSWPVATDDVATETGGG